MKIIEYKPEHLAMITPQKSQAGIDRSPECAGQLSQYDSFTGMVDGNVVAIGGLIRLSSTRAYLYLIVSDGIPYQWTSLYRAARRLIGVALNDFVRLESMCDFGEAERWLKMLGFQCEGTMRRAGPDGEDAKMYSIVRD